MKPFSEDDTVQRLKEDVARARSAYELAKEEFRAVSHDIPSGLPPPDGVQRIMSASVAQATALDRYMKAMRAFSDYVLGQK